jgi:hypothetical protein
MLLPAKATSASKRRCVDARSRLISSRALVRERLDALTLALGSSAAEGMVRMRVLPPKLNPLLSLSHGATRLKPVTCSHYLACALLPLWLTQCTPPHIAWRALFSRGSHCARAATPLFNLWCVCTVCVV